MNDLKKSNVVVGGPDAIVVTDFNGVVPMGEDVAGAGVLHTLHENITPELMATATGLVPSLPARPEVSSDLVCGKVVDRHTG